MITIRDSDTFLSIHGLQGIKKYYLGYHLTIRT